MIGFRNVRDSASVYPITMMYFGGTVIIMAVARGGLTVWLAVSLLALVAILVSLYATWREMRSVHRLVALQRAELLERIDQLTRLLSQSGIAVPAGAGQSEGKARR